MKKKVTLLCAVAAMGVVAAAGVSLQNRAQLSDVALANIEALAGCDNTTPGICWNEETIVFPYGFTGRVCLFTNDLETYCTGNYIDNMGQLH